ncbi:MAG: helix-turn-helix transcriptional regulator [Clostridia bacterium]|nr:helix-turn-helix transcriptional regulator [Clostridia bacterium]
MELNQKQIGQYIQTRRRAAGLTQQQLSERLHITAQSVSNWERGALLPDTATLPDLAMILNTSVDEILGGGSTAWRTGRRLTVTSMQEAIGCIRRMRELLGSRHFMYRTIVEALDSRMNSSIEAAFSDEAAFDAYTCEALLECLRLGDYVDRDDVQRHISTAGPREYTLHMMDQQGLV